MYTNVSDLSRAVQVVDKYCFDYGYTVLELDNRLSKPQTQDVVFKIQIGGAVCEFQLAMSQSSTFTHLDHSIY